MSILICKNCGYQSEKQIKVCPNCGSKDFDVANKIRRPEKLEMCKLDREYEVLPFMNVLEYFKYYNDIPITNRTINGSSETYQYVFDYTKRNAQNIIDGRNPNTSNRSWFGEPLISSAQEGLDRTRYQRMDDYENIYNLYIKPRIQDIVKSSMAKLEQPQMRFNDRQLGIFDFNRASLGLIPVYKYYSIKHKKMVEGDEVDIVQDGEKFIYKLIKDGSPVALVPSLLTDDDKLRYKIYDEIYKTGEVFETIAKYDVRIGGVDAFTSTYKKVWVLKEKVKKLKNAIRIFVKIGENAYCRFDNYKWNGYLALGIAEVLDMLGYAVNIVGIYGTNQRINYNKDGKLIYGTRFNYINLKRFDETLDKGSILYFTSDMTFFRLKIFDCLIKEADKNFDYIDTGLGSSAEIPDIEKVIYKEFGRRDKMWNNKGLLENNSQFLYYIIGDIATEQELSQKLLDITTDVINKNAEARQLFG